MNIKQRCKESYQRLENLKLVANEVGIPWQTVYVYLKEEGVKVVGNKERYGSETDKFAARAERYFKSLIPEASNMNDREFQSKIDFTVNGLGVDVKASNLNQIGKSKDTGRWAFSVKKQEFIADFIVAFAYQDGEVKHCFLFPREIIKNYATISVSRRGGKWLDYALSPEELVSFFRNFKSETGAA